VRPAILRDGGRTPDADPTVHGVTAFGEHGNKPSAQKQLAGRASGLL
jgi:hypothetical protein